MDKTKLNNEIEIGAQASREYEIVKPRLDAMIENFHKAWENTKQGEDAEREILWRQLYALRRLEVSFMQDIDTAKMATKQLEAENARNH